MSLLWGSTSMTGKTWGTLVTGTQRPSLSPGKIGLIWAAWGEGLSKEAEEQKLISRPQTASRLPPQVPRLRLRARLSLQVRSRGVEWPRAPEERHPRDH